MEGGRKDSEKTREKSRGNYGQEKNPFDNRNAVHGHKGRGGKQRKEYEHGASLNAKGGEEGMGNILLCKELRQTYREQNYSAIFQKR